MRYRNAPAAILTILVLVGCGKQQPAPPAATSRDPLEQTARDAAQAIRQQQAAAQAELDQFAEELRGAAQTTRKDVQNRVEGEINRAKQSLTNKVDQHSREMAEYAAELAEDAKDQALDIPDVLDEFFGAPRENRRTQGRSDRSRR